ncbi:mucosa-associated lymphoid tissue lymphoma translocation protein 1 [Gouania willdenowi]|uniref:Mucosa-associated lymphoid tissue lymphoma translocation protein 1-like n=1 Tax=Gouania willdenowi TaxID=441366 RepID=A0A8C5GTF1_GOUWI|nr:mucosa-associated lymphoid tissue lymphoma translocation protein 1-like [Gouania willdenowi]
MNGLWLRPGQIMVKEIVIVRQPVSMCVPVNHQVTLHVQAEGTGILNYQWFSDGEKEVFGATQTQLTVRAEKTQLYVCRVNDPFNNYVFTEWVKVKVLDIDKSGLPADWQGEPHIAINPKPQTVRHGQKITLRFAAFGIPLPRYQWYLNGHALTGKTANALQIDCATDEHKGSYLCSVSNVLEESWTEPVDVNVVQKDTVCSSALTASDKVALLLGNLNYSSHPPLKAPLMDVYKLGTLLQQLGFRVVSLLDLTRAEMQAAINEFIQLLDRGVYGLFYYAGHGFEFAGKNYLVPIEAPQPYRKENCVCVQKVMLRMQQRQTALNVILLDACRTWVNNGDIPSTILLEESSGNTIYGYATCENAEALEVQDGETSYGIFTNYLNRHILQPQPITDVLRKVQRDLEYDPLAAGRQPADVKGILKEPRSLTDDVRTTGHTEELHLRDTFWRQANDLPRKKLLVFECGVEVEVGFSALFSNVMVAFATVKKIIPQTHICMFTLSSTPAMDDTIPRSCSTEAIGSPLFQQFDGPDCTLRLCDLQQFNAMEDVFSRCDTSEELDSLLSHNSEYFDGCLRLCGLQRLEDSVSIKVELVYTHAGSKLRQSETQSVDVGMPLVASWKLYRNNPTASDRRQSSVSAQNMDFSLSSNHWRPWTVAASIHPFTRKALCDPKRTMTQINEPEENDETELLNYTLI